jgi:deoxyribonuclease-1
MASPPVAKPCIILVKMIKLLILFFSLSSFAQIRNYREASKVIPKIYQGHNTTLYCGCKYSGKTVDLKSCGYLPQKDFKRAQRIEWEHIVPAHAFGQAFIEWREGSPKCSGGKRKKAFKGRKCARRNPLFNKMEGDLYNLYPEVGELNGLRSNFSMAMIPFSKKTISFGKCTAKIEDRKFEPMDAAKGLVARTYMYMDQTYPGRGIISNKNAKLFEAWNKMYPVTPWECLRSKRIESVQKTSNSFLKKVCNLTK